MPHTDREARAVVSLVALLIAFKAWLSAWFPVTGDEAYFIAWGLQPDWGYYDHPPMVGWVLALLARISAAPWVLRLPVSLLPLVIALAMYLALSRIDRRKALYAALAFLLLPLNVWNVFITTDTPLVFFCFFSGLAWWKAREHGAAGWYVAAGVLLGLAFLSKYFSALLGLVFVVDAIRAPRAERALRGLAATLAAALPFGVFNLWWNYEHCWANLMFNLYNRHEEAGLSLRSPALFALVAAYAVSPVAAVQLWRRRNALGANAGPGLRFLALAAGLPFALFGVLSLVRSVGLHWVLAFVPFFFMAGALALDARQLRTSVVYLALFSLVHVAALSAAAALPVETWRTARIYDGLVFHFRIADVVKTLQRYEPEFVPAADGYSPAVTLGYYAGRYVFVFGTASSHARHDDLLTDFRALDGRNIVVFRKNAPEPGEYAAFFRSVELRTLELSGATFHLVLGRGFDYAAYRERVLAVVRDRFYRIPRYLPQGGCPFCERYFGTSCPVRGTQARSTHG